MGVSTDSASTFPAHAGNLQRKNDTTPPFGHPSIEGNFGKIDCMQIIYNGLVDYEYADALQRKLVSEKKKNPLQEDYLIFSEFNHVITLGRNVNESHILASRYKLENLGIRVLKIDRGGDVTYHGPGQLVIYPIIDLKRQVRDIRKYIRNLEQVVIDFLAKYNLEGYRVEDKTGVWVQDKKIASIGISPII